MPDTSILPALAFTLAVSIDYLLTGKNRTEKASPYDSEYEKEEYYWGLNPSELAERIAKIKEGEAKGRLLEISSGEGRDAVYFAQQGFQVDALEISLPGVEK